MNILFIIKKSIYLLQWKAYLTINDQGKFGLMAKLLIGQTPIFIFLIMDYTMQAVFEGERVYDGEIFKLEEHTERLFYSAKRMGIAVPYSQKK